MCSLTVCQTAIAGISPVEGVLGQDVNPGAYVQACCKKVMCNICSAGPVKQCLAFWGMLEIPMWVCRLRI